MPRTPMSLPSAFVFLLLAAAAYGALVLLVSCSQSRLIYFPDMPSRELTATPRQIGLAYESVEFTTDDGVKLHGWFVPAAEPRGTLLFFHGNAGNISHRLDSLRIFHDLGLSSLILDYRGYGQSEGTPSEEGTYLDAEAALRFLQEQRGVAAGDLIVFGRSLGAAIAAHLASRHRVRALILESAFTSVPEMAATLYPFLPTRWLVRFSYATKDYVRERSCPLLVIHSRDDEIIPFEQGQALFAAANPPKRFLELRGGHNDGFLASRGAYVETLDEFIRTLE